MTGRTTGLPPYPTESPAFPANLDEGEELFKVDLAQIKGLISSDIVSVEEVISQALESESRPVEELVSHVSQYSGKRLRPALILLTAKALGDLNEDHIRLAAVIELIHTATLVHDDILDGASMRRRIESVNALHGNHVSVLLGDMIYANAFKLSLSLSTVDAAKALAEVTRTICAGEIEQIFYRYEFDLSEERYYAIIGAKTASLYGAACELAAHYCGAAPEVQARLKDYGYFLGTAFQIVDDCLDIVGEEKVVGKSLGTDIERGKMTLPLMHLSRTLPPEGVKRLEEIFHSKEMTDKSAIIEKEFNLRASLDYAFGEADRFVQAGLDGLECLESSLYKEALIEAARFVLVRKV